jgi:TolA-binding protein
MHRTKTLRHRLLGAAAAVALLVSVPVPAHAVNKDMVELQTQVQQLLDMVQRLQSTMDTRFGALQHMVETTADDANRMTAAVNALQQKIQTQVDANNGKLDLVSGQMQGLNDSVDELKSRMTRLDKSLQDLQGQLQNMQSQPAVAQPAGAQPAGAQSASPPATVYPAPAPAGGGGAAAVAPVPPPAAVAPAPQVPPLKETLEAGVRDYNAARYDVATGEFQDVLHYYPLDDLAGTAQFYLGEIAYKQLNFPDAVKDFNAVVEGFPGNKEAPAAQLRKGLALLQLNKRDLGIHELRTLILRHPQTPEAAQARTKLNGMGVKIIAGK